jgi:hypothetical protein
MISLINMGKKLKIFLIFGIFSLFILQAGFSFAITAPSICCNLDPPCNGICDGQVETPLSVLLTWTEVSGVHHYELYYKKENDKDWTDRYPSVPQYTITGLAPSPSPENPLIYQWYVVSCADPDCAVSASSKIYSFSTQTLAPPSNGGGGDGGGGPIGLINPLKAKTLEEAINALINFLFFLAMAIAPILIIYAAFLILTAGGDATKINKARTIILWTLVAVAIILFAKGLPSVIKGAFGG